jgi:hypothetical protein
MHQACDAIALLATKSAKRTGALNILSAAQGIPRHWAAEP